MNDFFSSAEQSLLMELYDDYRDIITEKGNTTAINKAREMAWQKIADRLNVLVMQVVQVFHVTCVFHFMLFCVLWSSVKCFKLLVYEMFCKNNHILPFHFTN